MDQGHSKGRAVARFLESPSQWYDVPFAPVPNWLLREFPEIPPADRSVVAILFAHLYSTIPFGAPLSACEIGERARLACGTTQTVLRRRIRAGWVEETSPGKYRLSVQFVTRATRLPEEPKPPPSAPAPTQYSLADAVPAPPELLEAWAAYLDDVELEIVRLLTARSWLLGAIDARISVHELAHPTPAVPVETRRGRHGISEVRVRRALARLMLMGALWRIEAPETTDPQAPAVYRLNREWHRRLQER